MVTGKLRLHRRLRTLSICLLALLIVACNEERPIGVTLLFLNTGTLPALIKRFDPDGRRGPVPGALGRGGQAQMAFMAGDSEHGAPQFVDIGWSLFTPEYESAIERIEKPKGKISKAQGEEHLEKLREAYRLAPNYTRRIDLTPIITPEIVAQVRADPQSTHLKLTVTFKDDDVSIAAEAYRWRKAPVNRDSL